MSRCLALTLAFLEDGLEHPACNAMACEQQHEYGQVPGFLDWPESDAMMTTDACETEA